jgi:predicted ATP-dependent endonuclease of OLD family
LLPLRIEKLALTKIGSFDNFEMNFHRNSINVISGPKESGKSTIIRCILLAFGLKHVRFPNSTFGNGTIKLKLFSDQDFISITWKNARENATRGYRCLLADDPLERLSTNMIAPLFTELKRLGIQIIMTASIEKTSQIPKGIHIISLQKQ